MALYEHVFLARQDLAQAQVDALAENATKILTDNGGTVVDKVLYDANASNFSAEISQIAGKDPEAVVLVTFAGEFPKVIPELIKQGISQQDGVQSYMVDGNASNGYTFDPGTLEGIRQTYPGAELTSDFRDRLLEVDPKLEDFTYGPESFDAIVLAALAATAAGSDAGEAIASQLQAVSLGGTKCTEFAECVKLLEDGEDIDYEGVSGPIDFNDTGSPSAATIGISEYGKDNTYEFIDYVTGQI